MCDANKQNFREKQEIKNDSILKNYKEVKCYMIRYGAINISKKDQEIFYNSNDFLNYSKAVFNNKKNRKKFKFIICLEIFKIISIVLIVLAICFNIPNAINKNFDYIFYFLFASFCFGIVISIWNYIVYDGRGWFLWGYKNIEGKDKSFISSYFVSEYLKCRFECLKNLKLSKNRIEQIKGNFNYAYYNLDKKDTNVFLNKDKKINKKWNENNYIQKSNKIKKILNYNYFYEITLIFLGFISAIIVLNVFVF